MKTHEPASIHHFIIDIDFIKTWIWVDSDIIYEFIKIGHWITLRETI